MALASASGSVADRDVESKGSAIAALRGQAAGRRSRARAASARSRRPRTVTVAGAVSVAAIPCWRRRQRSRASRRSRRRAGRARPRGRRACRSRAGRRRRSASGRGRAARPRPTARRSRRRRARGRRRSSVPSTSGRPSASLIRASASSAPIAVAADREAAGAGVERHALADLGGVERDVGVDRAGRLDQRQRRERRDVGRVRASRRPVTGAPPSLATDRRSAGSGPTATIEPGDRPPLAPATATSPARSRTSPSSAPDAARGCR